MGARKQIKTKTKRDKDSLQDRIKSLEIAAAKEVVDQMFVIMDGIEGAIYVADMETYELLHVNSYIKKHFGNSLVGKKCYKVLHDQHWWRRRNNGEKSRRYKTIYQKSFSS